MPGPVPTITGPIVQAAPNPRPPTRVARQIPVQQSWVEWDAPSLRAAVESHELGVFAGSAQLVDWMGRDDRVKSTLGTRINAVQGLPFRIEPNPDSKNPEFARKLAEEAARCWKRIAPRTTQADVRRSNALNGFCVGQLLWDTSGGSWVPQVELWDTRHLSWRWDLGCYQASTLDGIELIRPGDGQWVVFSPHGLYRGWMQGGVRTLAILALLRQYALRDWGRASELYGMGVRLGYLPANADPEDEERFLRQLVELGAESVLLLAKGETEEQGFDFDIKALSGAFTGEVFERLGARCDLGITLELLGQNLTTEASGGSLALGQVQDKVRLDYLEADVATDVEGWGEQVLYPWAAYNFGAAPEDVPIPIWDTEPPENKDASSKVIVQVGQGLQALAALPGVAEAVDVQALLERFDIPILSGATPRLQAPAPSPPAAPPASPFGLAALAADGAPDDRAARWVDRLSDASQAAAAEALSPLLEEIRGAVEGASSPGELRARLVALVGHEASADLAAALRVALEAAHLAGRVAVAEGEGA